jgi:hypothetical protein
MIEGEVHVLDVLHVVAGNHNAQFGQRRQSSTGEPRQTDGHRVSLVCHRHSLENIGRIPTRADGDQDIARTNQAGHLFGKHILEITVVGPGRYQANVVGERQSPQASLPGHNGGFAKVNREVRGRRRAPAVSANVDGAIRLARGSKDLDNGGNVVVW